jgi:hypothetical protein
MAGWQYTKQVLCPHVLTKISLKSEVIRVNWSRVDLNEIAIRYKHTDVEVFDIAVCNTHIGSEKYLFYFMPSPWFLYNRFGPKPE